MKAVTRRAEAIREIKVRWEALHLFVSVQPNELRRLVRGWPSSSKRSRYRWNSLVRKRARYEVSRYTNARCAAVALGRKGYEAARADPTKMPKGREFEALLSVAAAAFEQRTDKIYEHTAAFDIETFSNKDEWK